MEPLPPTTNLIEQAASRLLGCYYDEALRTLQKALLILAYKCGSATLREASKVVRIPAAMERHVLAAAPGPLVELGLIRRIGPTQPDRAFGRFANDTKYEIVDHDRSLVWIKNSYRPTTTRPSCPPSRPAPEK